MTSKQPTNNQEGQQLYDFYASKSYESKVYIESIFLLLFSFWFCFFASLFHFCLEMKVKVKTHGAEGRFLLVRLNKIERKKNGEREQ